jgi:hypothetical protein
MLLSWRAARRSGTATASTAKYAKYAKYVNDEHWGTATARPHRTVASVPPPFP